MFPAAATANYNDFNRLELQLFSCFFLLVFYQLDHIEIFPHSQNLFTVKTELNGCRKLKIMSLTEPDAFNQRTIRLLLNNSMLMSLLLDEGPLCPQF